MKIYSFLALMTFVVCGTLSGHAQNLILNGDFSANASQYTVYPGIDTSGSNPAEPTDWTIATNPAAVTGGWGGVNGTGTGVGNVYGPANLTINTGGSVSDFVFGQRDPNISQTFSVVAGQTYALDYDAASRNQPTSNNSIIFATVTDDGALNTLLFAQSGAYADAEFYANTTPGLLLDTVGTGNTFTADETGLVTLTFTSANPVGAPTDPSNPGSDHSIAVAEVMVEEVPEPSPLSLCLGGAALMLLFPCRRFFVSRCNS